VPELPEVESVRRSLLPHIRGRTITNALLRRRDVLIAPGDPAGGHSRQRSRAGAHSPRPVSTDDLLVGSPITDILRHGKQLAILARSGRSLVVQLGMSGTLELMTAHDEPDKHTHAVWTLDSGVRFRFHDPRRFGALRVFRSHAELDEHWSSLGPDALTITGPQLLAALTGSRRAIKAALLDQAVLAGVGNIYADESLFLSRISPRFRADRVSPEHAMLLAASIRKILTQSVSDGGSTLRDYTDADGKAGSYQSRHTVYGRAGLPCPNCGRPLTGAVLAQRTTVWCHACQPARPAPIT
jgi:formamidopyrimidine-DNA glycosylase